MASQSRNAGIAAVFLTLTAVFLAFTLVTCLPDRAPVTQTPHAVSRQTPVSAASPTASVPTPRPEPQAVQSSPPPAAPLKEAEQPSPPPASPKETEHLSLPPAAPPQQPEQPAAMAVIIDDAGYSLEDLQPFLDFPEPLTIAVLPNLPNSTEAARRVRAAGKGLLLHLPMQPVDQENPGPGAIRTDQSDEVVRELLDKALASVPGAEGVNNHMGSAATADERVMRIVLSEVKRRGLVFVDSRTTADTVAARVAQELSVPFTQRNVFIDNEQERADIEKCLRAGAEQARSHGTAVLIGHVHTPQILSILNATLPGFRETGVRLSGLADILSSKDQRE